MFGRVLAAPSLVFAYSVPDEDEEERRDEGGAWRGVAVLDVEGAGCQTKSQIGYVG